MARRSITALGIAFIATATLAPAAGATEPAPGATVLPCGEPAVVAPALAPDLAARLLVLVNETRAAHGLAALQPGGGAAMVDEHAVAMATRGSIWHNDAWFLKSTRSMLGAGALGENVGCHGSVEGVHQAFLASPGHLANVLDARFTAATFAVAVRPDTGTLFAVEGFIQQKQQPAPVAPAPAPIAPRPPAPDTAVKAPAPTPIKHAPVASAAAPATARVAAAVPVATPAPSPAPLPVAAQVTATTATTPTIDEPATGARATTGAVRVLGTLPALAAGLALALVSLATRRVAGRRHALRAQHALV